MKLLGLSLRAQPDARNDMPDVRKELCGLLVEAAENGKLSSALKASQGEALRRSLRSKSSFMGHVSGHVIPF